MNDDLRLELRIKNRVLWEETAGKYGTLRNFVASNPGVITAHVLGGLICLRVSPYRKNPLENQDAMESYAPTRTARRLAATLGREIAELFPPQIYVVKFPKLLIGKASIQTLTPLLDLPASDLLLPAPDDDAYIPGDFAEARREAIEACFEGSLTPREQRVIELRFGMRDGREHTLEEVAQDFSVSRERIRQIEAKAMRKLRSGLSPSARGQREGEAG